jgi:hypothetical protein
LVQFLKYFDGSLRVELAVHSFLDVLGENVQHKGTNYRLDLGLKNQILVVVY